MICACIRFRNVKADLQTSVVMLSRVSPGLQAVCALTWCSLFEMYPIPRDDLYIHSTYMAIRTSQPTDLYDLL